VSQVFSDRDEPAVPACSRPPEEVEEPVKEWRELVESQQPDSTGPAVEQVQVLRINIIGRLLC
jgi:hypothetical protein